MRLAYFLIFVLTINLVQVEGFLYFYPRPRGALKTTEPTSKPGIILKRIKYIISFLIYVLGLKLDDQGKHQLKMALLRMKILLRLHGNLLKPNKENNKNSQMRIYSK